MQMKYILIFGLILLVALMGCTKTPIESDNNSPTSLAPQGDLNTTIKQALLLVNKVEVIHFHGTSQCYSCKTVGEYAKETINTYFSEELKSGKITFSQLNYELKENQELVNKYGVTGSSLWIGVYSLERFNKEINNDVWYKIGDKTEYSQYFSALLTKRLHGILK